jgi:hypothetical protein
MTSKDKHVIYYAFEKETKGAVRYQQVDSDNNPIKGDENGALAETIYFRKKALGDHPMKMRVTIEEA